MTYTELAQRAKGIAATIQNRTAADATPLTAVFAQRSETASAALLGALLAGHGYVPLNRTFPVERTRLMLAQSLSSTLILDAGSEPQLDGLLAGFERSLLLLCPDRADASELVRRYPDHTILAAKDLASAEQWCPPDVSDHSTAYLLFTSGSTGHPKAVMVSHANVLHYLDVVIRRYGFTHTDRLSQTFDLTFDLSVHDLFVAWHTGACVCCPTRKQLFSPAAFIVNQRLTVWFSVPSTALFMRRLGTLKPDAYPHLRLVLFCGEALPVEAVRQWRLAAPNAVIENIYGPTELTIGCTAYRWDDEQSPAECEQGIVPIGEPFPDMETLIVDEGLNEVSAGTAGELLMTGPQLCLGYLDDEERTRRVFVTPAAGGGRTWYRTGDRVRREAANRPLKYLGRVDNQIKLLGYRVELGEVEAAVREVSGADGVVALGWPVTRRGADGLALFVEAESFDVESLLEQLKMKLPSYMLPRQVRVLPRFPLNSNGKYDRNALQRMLEEADFEMNNQPSSTTAGDAA
jgi:amino acid adenylation domain-containing protein